MRGGCRPRARRRASTPTSGDTAYYAPRGNLAIYYRDFGYSSGLVKLGSIDTGVEELTTTNGDFAVTIELAD